ncbi:type I restriction enzyme, S subunit [Anaerocolumna jejuensis DSM 15929]|uniref:Type I restriction enzyme, S subunit n=1 Tax=Anaerocolumna jejuensis DSM 15929 TaxID=1121322 RepID=A0A1M6YFT1_9FIRM|nr:restriction endonuclease subunit S [Anaerocolumna jejuensis]SHL17191.1 type I restriction enzyme, S subunit [Anaerocolumna jejuensis DSM 15929]
MNNKYKYYLDINERWIKNIPSHWKMIRLKRILQIRKEKNNPIVTNFILSLTANQGVIPLNQKEGAGGNKPKEDLTKYSIARKDDLLVNCMNVVAGSAGVSKWDGAISPVYYALYPRDSESCNIWYYHYIFRLLTFQRSLLGLGKGILMHESSTGKLNTVRMRISMDYLNNVNLPVPPRDEQDRIVKYLNWQVSLINKLIIAKHREIKALKEYKEVSISYYVTHGLHKTEMRKTEVYWLDKVPVSWKETKLQHILTKEKRIVPENAELLICSNSGEVKKRGNSKLGLVASSNDIYQGVNIGDLLIHGMDTWHGAIAISDFDGMCTPVVHVCTCSQSKRFVVYYLKMMAYTKVFKAISNGVRQNTSDFRSWDKVANLLIAFPDIQEQEEIADYIDNIVDATDAMINNYSKQIEALHDMKNRIISDVVTGQIDVSNIDIPDCEYVEVDSTDDEVDLEAEEEIEEIEEV